jgi:hypothetical protein
MTNSLRMVNYCDLHINLHLLFHRMEYSNNNARNTDGDFLLVMYLYNACFTRRHTTKTIHICIRFLIIDGAIFIAGRQQATVLLVRTPITQRATTASSTTTTAARASNIHCHQKPSLMYTGSSRSAY